MQQLEMLSLLKKAWFMSSCCHSSLSEEAVILYVQERRRIEKAGGMVSRLVNSEGRDVGPYRVFGPAGTSPGLAMARSLGDLVAHQLGVTPLPTCSTRQLTSADQFVVCFLHPHTWVCHLHGHVCMCSNVQLVA